MCEQGFLRAVTTWPHLVKPKATLTLFAIRDHVLLPFQDHSHIPQGLTESQHSSPAITAIHRVSQLQCRTPQAKLSLDT